MSDVKKLILLPSKVIEVEEADGVKIYLNPHITANYNESDEFIRLEGSQGATAKIELSEIEEINGAPFSGSFADLRLLIDPIIVEANTTGGSGGGGGAVDATIVADNVGLAKEAKQDVRISQETCKEAFYTITNNGSDSSDLVGNFEFTYWDGSAFVAYSEDVDGVTFNSIDELVTILNTNQSFFEFYNPPQNILPSAHNQDIGVRSGTVDLLTGFQQGSFVLESNDGLFDDSYNFAAAAPAESNTDKIVLNQERILESQNRAYENNQITHQTYTNPTNLVEGQFKRLSFVCSGAITVTINGTPIVYPFTIGDTEIIGNTYEVDINASFPVTFDGTGELVITKLN